MDNIVNFIHIISIKVTTDDASAFITKPPQKKKTLKRESQNFPILHKSLDQTHQILLLKVNECINVFTSIGTFLAAYL